MKILIIGTGAVGGFYGAKLAQGGEEVTCLARGRMLSTLQSNPIHIKSYQGDFDVHLNVIAEPAAYTGSPDLIIITVKTYDTESALQEIAAMVGPETLLLSLQNGVEAEQKMMQRFGPDKVLGAVCYIGAEVTTPGTVVHSANGAVTIGEMDGRNSERLENLYAIFKHCGIDTHKSNDIKKTLWNKLLWNAPFNQVCAIAHASVGEVLDSPELKDLLWATGQEVVALAQANGVGLKEKDISKQLGFSEKDLRPVRPSLLQDLERGKRLEHETFGGFIVREGKRLGIPTPVNETLYRFLCFLDTKASSAGAASSAPTGRGPNLPGDGDH